MTGLLGERSAGGKRHHSRRKPYPQTPH
jgi:hypothetical protein